MKDKSRAVIFLVGLGAPASMYACYLDNLKSYLSLKACHVIEWWSQNDFGISELQSCMADSEAILIGHSAGGAVALHALEKWPNQVKKVIMLDSHFLRSADKLSSVSGMLEVMLQNDNVFLQDKVKNAYATVVKNDRVFRVALKYAIQWVNESFDQACMLTATMPAHSILFVGFTDSGYQSLDAEGVNKLSYYWDKFGVDVKFIPMGHFDLVDEQYADIINQSLAGWLSFTSYD